jgi:hypothetical protein
MGEAAFGWVPRLEIPGWGFARASSHPAACQRREN